MAMTPKELRSAIEAILLIAGEPVTLDELAEAFPDEERSAVEQQLVELQQMIEREFGGFQLEHTAGGYRFATRPENDQVLKKFFAKKGEGRLSIAALETLSIIAYRQPITAPEISDLRGVNSSGVVRTLLERKLIRISGRKNVVGSPFLYRTTKEFLTHFGLNSIQDLPRLEEFAEVLGENVNEELAAIEAVEGAVIDGEGVQQQGDEARAGESDDVTPAETGHANAVVEPEPDPESSTGDSHQESEVSGDDEPSDATTRRDAVESDS